MSAFSDVRTSIKDALPANLNPFTTLPDPATPPLVFVAPSDPYITRDEGASFGSETLHHDITVVTKPGVSDVQADELDQMILDVLDAIDATDVHVIGEVQQPGAISLDGQKHLAVNITVLTEIHR